MHCGAPVWNQLQHCVISEKIVPFLMDILTKEDGWVMVEAAILKTLYRITVNWKLG